MPNESKPEASPLETVQPSQKTTATLASVIIAFACVYLFWGSTYTAISIGVVQMPALVLGGTRFLIAGLLMLGWCRLRGLRLLWPSRTMASMALVGCLLLTGGNVSLIYAEAHIPSGFASLIFAATPIYIALFEMALPKGEPLHLRGWIGVLLGFAGIVALLAPTFRHSAAVGFMTDKVRLIAIGVCFLGALSWAIGSLYSRHTPLPVNTAVAAAWQMIFAGTLNSLLAATLGQWPQAHWNRASIGSIAWLVTGGSLIGYSSFIYLLEHVPVAKVATYAYVNPIVAVMLGLLLLHEHLDTAELVGMAAIVIAVALLTSAQVRRKAAMSPALTEYRLSYFRNSTEAEETIPSKPKTRPSSQ